MGRNTSEQGRKYQLLQLNERHKEIARRLFLGEKPKQIADDLLVSSELVSIVRGSSLGQAYYHQEDYKRARAYFRESDALAVYNAEKQPDILFLNAFYEWKTAGEAGNPTRERIAFGRLKALRSSLERRFQEVEAFDDHMEGGRRHA